MRFLTLATTIASLLLGSTALAGPIDDIVAQFQSYGYDSIEIAQQGDIVRIEGVRNGTEREITYDVATKRILSDETGPAGDGHHDDSSDDSHDDDGSEDHGSDDEADDHGSDDHGEDDDGEDDD